MRPNKVQPLLVIVVREVMIMLEYSTLSKATELEPPDQMQFNFIKRDPFWGWVFPYAGKDTSAFSVLERGCCISLIRNII